MKSHISSMSQHYTIKITNFLIKKVKFTNKIFSACRHMTRIFTTKRSNYILILQECPVHYYNVLNHFSQCTV